MAVIVLSLFPSAGSESGDIDGNRLVEAKTYKTRNLELEASIKELAEAAAMRLPPERTWREEGVELLKVEHALEDRFEERGLHGHFSNVEAHNLNQPT